MEHLYQVSGSIVVFAVALLLGKPRKQGYDWWLICWLLVVLLHLAGFYAEWLGHNLFVLEMSSAAVVLHGPFLLGYTRALTKENQSIAWQDIWHLLPFLLHLGLVLPGVLQGTLAPLTPATRMWLMILKLGSVGSYMLLVLHLLRQHHKRLPHLFSCPDQLQLNWLRNVVIGILAVWGIGILSQFMFQTGGHELLLGKEDLFVNITASILVLVATFFGFRQTQIFTAIAMQPALPRENNIDMLAGEAPSGLLTSRKYQSSGVSAEAGETYWNQVRAYMQVKKPYQNPELTLTQLAADIGIHPNYLSQVINERAQLNFSDFINGYRVEEVKENIVRGRHKQYTLLALALESGFNSKASFNRAFKKFTQQTPSQYCKTLIGTELRAVS